MKTVGITEGINISVYQPVGGKKYSPVDIAKFLKKFQLNGTLKLIGELSCKMLMDENPEPIREIGGVPISDSVLAYLAMVAIENSNDYRKELITIRDIVKVADMYFGLPDPILSDKKLDPFLIRFGAAQFEYDREINNVLSRTFLIYSQLWNQVPEARKVNIDEAIKKISNLTIEEIVILGVAYFGGCKNGFFRIFDENQILEKDKQFFTKQKQNWFLEWISCSYWQFRKQSLAIQKDLPDSDYEKNRFNLLEKYPVLVPDSNPRPDLSQVYIVPITRLLLGRITRGLYFDLSDYFKGNTKANKFREAFGYVFQRYTGLLLEKSKQKMQVLPEWQYGKPEKRTPDWIVFEGNKAIIIEVKQSGLFLPAKTLGDIDTVKTSLSKTISQAVKQLWSFKQDIALGTYKELECFSQVIEFENLIITYDRMYFANSIIKESALELARKEIPSIPKDYHCHTISAEEFEYLLGLNISSLFDFLMEKRLGNKGRTWDFREYCGRMFKQSRFINQYLEKVKQEFLDYIETHLTQETKEKN